jgi:hypothetical protein
MTAGLIASAVVLDLFSVSRANGQGGPNPLPVTVVNTPLPVSGNISVANSPAVQAQQSGAWTVGAQQSGAWTVGAQQSGAWNVGISGTPNIVVANPSSAPVLLRDVDNPDKSPWQRSASVVVAAGSISANTILAVPAGKRFVIEEVSTDCALPVGQRIRERVLVIEGGVQVSHRIVATPLGTFDFGSGPFDVFEATHHTKIYAVGNIELVVARSDTSGTASVNFSLSGHLVDY